MQKQILKKAHKELKTVWRHAWEDVGFRKAWDYERSWYYERKTKSKYNSQDTIGDYREMMIYTDYNPNTRNDKLLFGLEYDKNKNKFFIAYVFIPSGDGTYPPKTEEEIFIQYLDFDFLKWRRNKDPKEIFKMVFPKWTKDLKEQKYTICLDFCSYVDKMVKILRKTSNMENDFVE